MFRDEAQQFHSFRIVEADKEVRPVSVSDPRPNEVPFVGLSMVSPLSMSLTAWAIA
jgi:hypothetical protein